MSFQVCFSVCCRVSLLVSFSSCCYCLSVSMHVARRLLIYRLAVPAVL